MFIEIQLFSAVRRFGCSAVSQNALILIPGLPVFNSLPFTPFVRLPSQNLTLFFHFRVQALPLPSFPAEPATVRRVKSRNDMSDMSTTCKSRRHHLRSRLAGIKMQVVVLSSSTDFPALFACKHEVIGVPPYTQHNSCLA